MKPRAVVLVVVLLLAGLCAGLVAGGALRRSGWLAGEAEASVLVRTEPTGAAVFIDGVYRGRGPLAVRVTPGEAHRLRVEADGYRPRHEAWTPGPGEHLVLLEPQPSAALRVRSDPPGATVLLDGVVRGRTPVELEDLAPGRTSVTLLLTNHIPETRAVVLEPGGRTILELALRHRQVEAYRAFLEKAPRDIQIHNDLVRLLFVLERDREAARAILDALELLGDEAMRRHHPEATEKTWKEFQSIHRQKRGRIARALDEEIVAALTAGSISTNAIRAYVQTRGPWQDPSRLETVLSAALLHGRLAQAGPLIDAVADAGRGEALLAAVDRLLEAPELDPATGVLVLQALRRYAGSGLPESPRAAVIARAGALLARLEATEDMGDERTPLLFARAWYETASGEGAVDDETIRALEAAVASERDHRLRQQYRLRLAEIYLDREDLAKARQAAAAVLQDQNYFSRAHQQSARHLLERIGRRGGP